MGPYRRKVGAKTIMGDSHNFCQKLFSTVIAKLIELKEPSLDHSTQNSSLIFDMLKCFCFNPKLIN